jgi:hypothetical protein
MRPFSCAIWTPGKAQTPLHGPPRATGTGIAGGRVSKGRVISHMQPRSGKAGANGIGGVATLVRWPATWKTLDVRPARGDHAGTAWLAGAGGFSTNVEIGMIGETGQVIAKIIAPQHRSKLAPHTKGRQVTAPLPARPGYARDINGLASHFPQ